MQSNADMLKNHDNRLVAFPWLQEQDQGQAILGDLYDQERFIAFPTLKVAQQ